MAGPIHVVANECESLQAHRLGPGTHLGRKPLHHPRCRVRRRQDGQQAGGDRGGREGLRHRLLRRKRRRKQEDQLTQDRDRPGWHSTRVCLSVAIFGRHVRSRRRCRNAFLVVRPARRHARDLQSSQARGPARHHRGSLQRGKHDGRTATFPFSHAYWRRYCSRA